MNKHLVGELKWHRMKAHDMPKEKALKYLYEQQFKHAKAPYSDRWGETPMYRALDLEIQKMHERNR